MRTMITTMVLGLSLLAAASNASAFGGPGGPGFGPGFAGRHGGPGGEAGLPLRLLVRQMTPDQRRQVWQLLAADRGARRDILVQLRAAHEALADKILAGGTVAQADVTPDVERVATLHRQLMDHGTQLMLKVRAVATPEQLAQAAATKKKLDQLRDEMVTLLGRPSDEDGGPAE